jgi:outer membrane protein OmpA-like peptidoglycan-associated protein
LWIVQTEYTLTPCNQPTAASINAVAALAVKSNGTVTRTQVTTSQRQASSVRIDPGGRPVFLTTDAADTSKVYMSRLKTDGSLDTTVGDAGFLLLNTGALPTGAVRLNVSFAGVVTTAERVYFAIMLYDQELLTYQNASTTPRTHGFRMALASPTTGFAANYGTGGIGQRHTALLAENAFGQGQFAVTGFSVDSTGRPVNFTFTDTTVSYNVWSAITGATGGGEGGTGLGGFTRDTGGAPSAGSGSAAGRVDTKVYTKLPAKTEIYTAFLGLSGKQARTLKMSSNTKNTCVVVGRHVALVAAGSCEVQVQSKATGATIRTLRTTVVEATAKTQATSAAEAGTTMVASDPILFKKSSANITKIARGQIRELKDSASDAAGVVVIGHAATLTDASNFSLSRNRAQNVSAMMQRLKVRKPIAVVAKGKSEPLSTKETEKAQAQNRRVVVYLIPSS